VFADEELHRHAAENIAQADALLFGRVTYEMMGERGVPTAPALRHVLDVFGHLHPGVHALFMNMVRLPVSPTPMNCFEAPLRSSGEASPIK